MGACSDRYGAPGRATVLAAPAAEEGRRGLDMDGRGEVSAAVRWWEHWVAAAAGRGGGRWAEATWC